MSISDVTQEMPSRNPKDRSSPTRRTPGVDDKSDSARVPPGTRTDQRPSNQPLPSFAAQEVVQKCTDVVDRFHRRNVGWGEAVFTITSHLTPAAAGASPDFRALKSYLTMLGPQRNHAREEPPRAPGDPPADPAATDGAAATRTSREAGARGLDAVTGDDSDARRSKRQAKEALYAWTSDPSFIDEVDDLTQRTRELRRNYMLDIKSAVTSLLAEAKDLRGFPLSLWDKILKGEYLDFDKLVTVLFDPAYDEGTIHTINRVEVRAGGTQSNTRRVTTHGQWGIAFNEYRAAVCVAYPHKATELAVYQKRMLDIFKSVNLSAHSRVLELDCAMRRQASFDVAFSLINEAQFAVLTTTLLSSIGGAGSSFEASAPASSSRRSCKRSRAQSNGPAVCNRFNSRDGCLADSCQFRHVCRECREPGHGAQRCPKRSGQSAGAT